MTRTCSRCGESGHDIRTCPVPLGHTGVMRVGLSEGYGRWQPECSDCGWSGSWHTDRDEALSEAMSHQYDTRG
jgi:hypothetical protein